MCIFSLGLVESTERIRTHPCVGQNGKTQQARSVVICVLNNVGLGCLNFDHKMRQ